MGKIYRQYPGVKERNRHTSRKPRRRARKHWTDLLRIYKLTQDGFNEWMLNQKELCTVCEESLDTFPSGIGNPELVSVHHDHECCPGQTSCGNCIMA